VKKWVQTDKWKPIGGGGSQWVPVECDDELGLGKLTNMAPEVIASSLAQEAGITGVPLTDFGEYNGKLVAVSRLWGVECIDVPKIMGTAAATDPAFLQGLRNGSGLLAFHAWIGTRDLKDAHVLVRFPAPESYEVCVIDFADALTWQEATELPTTPGAPPCLVNNRDAGVIGVTLAKIEAVDDARIAAIVAGLPAPASLGAADQNRITSGLKLRKSKLREGLGNAGWL